MDSYEGSSTSPLSLHKYLYGHGDGVNQIDPSGNFTILQALIVVALLTIIVTMSSCTNVWKNINKPATISIDWQVTTWTMKLGGNLLPLDDAEVQIIKTEAIEVTKRAFAYWVVSVQEGKVGNVIHVIKWKRKLL